MKNVLPVAFALLLTSNAFAIRETGGVPPAPRAVVVQGHLQNGSFDEQGHKVAAALAANYLVEGKIEAVTQRTEKQSDDRTYLCIEFSDYSDYLEASENFKKALLNHPSLEVVSNSTCK